MIRSQNEIAAIIRQAARGAGAPPGQAEDLARTAGVDDPATVVDALIEQGVAGALGEVEATHGCGSAGVPGAASPSSTSAIL